ncbi:MAG TPA: hypothetical protein VI423_02710 [Paenisporosarcina sp.]|nr:hypothetical protein [Paenisporosarcina sp.]
MAAYESQELTQMDSFVVDRLLADIKRIVRTQPVQLPAEFAFFGRAVSTFVGVLHVLDPKVDLLAIARPRVLEWAAMQKGGENSFSKDDALRVALNVIGPLRAIPQKILSYLDEPTRMREYMQIRDAGMEVERSRLQTRMFAGIVSVLSLASTFFGVWNEHIPLIATSGFFFIVAAFVFKGKSPK